MMATKLAAVGLAMAMFAGGAASAQPDQPIKVTTADRRMINSCLAMSHERMMKNDGCLLMMQKMKVTGDEMTVIASCAAMSKEAMEKDKACIAVNAAHPGMMP
jgi:hypothetical protein